MKNDFNLDLIFKLLKYPKFQGTPPKEAKIVFKFDESRYFDALKEFGNLPNSDLKTKERAVYLYTEYG